MVDASVANAVRQSTAVFIDTIGRPVETQGIRCH